MSKSLRSITESERQKITERRLKDETGGLGYWAAVDYRYNDPFAKLTLGRSINKKWQKK